MNIDEELNIHYDCGWCVVRLARRRAR